MFIRVFGKRVWINRKLHDEYLDFVEHGRIPDEHLYGYLAVVSDANEKSSRRKLKRAIEDSMRADIEMEHLVRTPEFRKKVFEFAKQTERR